MKNKLAIVVVGALVVVLVGAFVYRIGQSKERNAVAKAASEKTPITAVRTSTATTKDMPQVVQITGNIKATNDVQVLPESPGRITNVYVDIGSVVKANQVLATVEAVDMALRVKQAQAQLQQAQAGLEQAKVQKATAERAIARAKALHAKGAMSQADFESADSGAQLAGVGVMAAEAAVALADANLALTQKAFEDTRITTPVAGIVTRRAVNVGTMATPAMMAFSVQDQTSLKMEGAVPAAYVPKLQLGVAVEILVDELPGRTFQAKISRLAPTLDAETRRGNIEIALEPAEGLLPNMFGRAEIAFGSTDNVLVVPATAVLSVGGQPAIYVIEKNDGSSVAKLVHPRLGPKHFDGIIIEEGLSSGDTVVISGNAGIKDGSMVVVSGS